MKIIIELAVLSIVVQDGKATIIKRGITIWTGTVEELVKALETLL